MKKNKKIENLVPDKKITRKQAIKKAAGYTALTAATILFLDTKASAQGSSPSPPPSW